MADGLAGVSERRTVPGGMHVELSRYPQSHFLLIEIADVFCCSVYFTVINIAWGCCDVAWAELRGSSTTVDVRSDRTLRHSYYIMSVYGTSFRDAEADICGPLLFLFLSSRCFHVD